MPRTKWISVFRLVIRLCTPSLREQSWSLMGLNHLLLKEDDIVGVLDTADVKDLKPLNERVLIKLAEAEYKTAGGLLLTEATKGKPSIGTWGLGHYMKRGKRRAFAIAPGRTVMYSKYAGSEFRSDDGSNYIVLRASDVMTILSSQQGIKPCPMRLLPFAE